MKIVQGGRVGPMTWDQVEAGLTAGLPVVLPIGAGCKEHGLHLPMENDFLMAEYLADRLLGRVPCLVLPTLSYGFYPAFVEYPGSVSLRLEVMRDTVADICHSLHAQGAQRFYALNTGISTRHPLRAAQTLLRGLGIDFRFTDLEAACAAAEERLREGPGGSHADEMETSMMLYIAPAVVQMERARRDFHSGEGPLTRRPNGAGVYSPTGAWGDPTLATLQKGKILVESLVDYLVRDLG